MMEFSAYVDSRAAYTPNYGRLRDEIVWLYRFGEGLGATQETVEHARRWVREAAMDCDECPCVHAPQYCDNRSCTCYCCAF